MSDRRIQGLLRAFRLGDRDAGPKLILALGRADQLQGSVITWKIPKTGGPSPQHEERIFEWDPYDGFRCPECDTFWKLGPVQVRRYEQSTRYVFRCHPKIPFPPWQDVQGSLTLGKDRGHLSASQIADLVGENLLEIRTAAEIQEALREESLEALADDQHAAKLSEKALVQRKIKNARRGLARWTRRHDEWHDEHDGRPLFPGDSQERDALQEKVVEFENLVIRLSPEEPDAPPSMLMFKSSLVEKHHLASLWLHKYTTEGLNGVSVDLIMVEEDHRGEGHGQRAMEELCEYADRVGLYLALTPSNVHGSSVRRLKKWYRSLGFKKNTGRGTDYRFSESMLRPPRGKEND